MNNLLYQWDKEKKDKHGKDCHKQQKHFSPFVLSGDVILGNKALVAITDLSRLMVGKFNAPISHICVLVNQRI